MYNRIRYEFNTVFDGYYFMHTFTNVLSKVK